MSDKKFNSIDEAIEDIKLGKMIIVVDDPHRENEGDLVMAAEKVTGEAINFMATHGKGLICAPMSREKLNMLSIEPMVTKNTDRNNTAFTVSVDYKDSTTGISAYERAKTILKLMESEECKDFKRPGHIFPLEAKVGGVLEREGHTEAAVDLAKLAGLKGGGVICEVMKEDGTMARVTDLMEFAKLHELKIITIKDLVDYRLKEENKNEKSNKYCVGNNGIYKDDNKNKENIIKREVEIIMPTKYGDFKLFGYINKKNGNQHIALVKGEIGEEPILTRVHSECLTGDVLGSKRCDCGEQYDYAMKKIAEEGRGILIYMRQEGRGIGLINKLKAYELQDAGLDTVEANIKLGFKADEREYKESAEILKNLGVERIMLLTNNPSKILGLKDNGIEVVERIPIDIKSNKNNAFYLRTKKIKMNHMIE